MIETEIFPAYEEFLQPARFKVPFGGRGSAKTRQVVSILLNNVDFYGWRLVCFREIMKSIDDSVYQEFFDEIERTNRRDDFKILGNSIHSLHGPGVIKFEGLLRNQAKLKGYANFDAALVEEAENISTTSWKYLIPTFRKAGSEIWVIFNPDDPLGVTYRMFVTERKFPDYLRGKRYCIVKQINYTDNPRFPQELQDDMELMRENDPEMYRHVYLGEPVANSELAVIKPVWIAAARGAHIKLGLTTSGGRIGGFDVADEGPDKNAMVVRHGIIVNHCEEWRDQDPNSAARHVFAEARRLTLDTVHYDDIGVGAGAKGAIREEQARAIAAGTPARVDFRGFTASAAVNAPDAEYMPGKRNGDMFYNLKAQAWWTVADRFRNTYDAIQGKPFDPDLIVSIDSSLPNIEQLCGELAQPRREFLNGKVKVESKDAMKKRGVKSPNLADAFIMAFAPEGGAGMLEFLRRQMETRKP